jgi:hypothetical protein
VHPVGSITTPLKFRHFDKAEPNSQFHGIYIHNDLIRIWVWVSFICLLSGTPVLSALCPQLSLLNPDTPSEKKIPGVNPPPKKNAWVCHCILARCSEE